LFQRVKPLAGCSASPAPAWTTSVSANSYWNGYQLGACCKGLGYPSIWQGKSYAKSRHSLAQVARPVKAPRAICFAQRSSVFSSLGGGLMPRSSLLQLLGSCPWSRQNCRSVFFCAMRNSFTRSPKLIIPSLRYC